MWESSAVQTVTWMGCAILLMGVLFWMKARFQKQARENVKILFITPEGNGWCELWPVEDGWVKVPAKKKGEVKKAGPRGKSWPIAKVSTFLTDHPENFPRFVQCKIQTVVIRTDRQEPISNITGKPSLMPGMIQEKDNEKTMSIVAQQSKNIDERLTSLEKQTTPRGVLIGFAIVILAIAIIGYYLYMNVPAMQETLDTIKAGMGL